MEFSSVHNNNPWILTSVYGPCDNEGKVEFMHWFENIQMPDDLAWLIIGDFNLYRKPEDRNRAGGNVGDMLLFNNAISALGLVEIPLHGRKFTWTNKQHPPLLERLDWFFSSQSWTLRYPLTIAHSLVMETSDHWPCVIKIKTFISKGGIFRFENCWMAHESFLPMVASCWNGSFSQQDAAKLVTAKFKSLRCALRHWQAKHSNLKITIENVKLVISFLDSIDGYNGPDGFNNEFLKNCWFLIKHDFYKLCSAFFSEEVCLQSNNASFITLIPKIDGPSTISEYRPISLLNSSVKIITELLANRLQP